MNTLAWKGSSQDGAAAKADPMREAAEIAVAFVELVQRIDGAPREQPEVGGVGCDLDVGQGIDDAVEQPRRISQRNVLVEEG